MAYVPSINVTGQNMIMTGTDLRSIFGESFYTALSSYISLAQSVDTAMTEGDFRDLVSLSREPIRANCAADESDSPLDITEQGLAIRCVDGDDVRNKTVDYWEEYIGDLVDQSDTFGQTWSLGRVSCAGWPVRPNWDFNGPFESPKADSDIVPGKPAAPILFMSPRLDPVTPLKAAREMSRGHPGSRLVIVELEGHCAITSGPSKCRDEILREYFDTGDVPEEQETICEADCGPWDEDCTLDRGGEGDARVMKRGLMY